jgi:uncharacterized iron-regulated membrane protein
MNRRNYSVFYNLHTVSGIVISVALFVIFFAGAFALFHVEISVWEKGGHPQKIAKEEIDFEQILSSLDSEYELTSRDLQINFPEEHPTAVSVRLAAAKDTLATAEAKNNEYFIIDIDNGKRATYQENYDLGEFLFRLHFFSQIPYIGIYLSGFVSLFFLFAIVTGVLVHWKKIVSNFYVFRPKEQLKRVWSDAHTALGVIGLPFQFIYAVTGAYFGLSILVLLPANFLYHGDQDKLMGDLRPDRKLVNWIGKSEEKPLSFNDFIKDGADTWDNFKIQRAFIKNYGGVNMQYLLVGQLADNERFLSTGRVSMNPFTGEKTIGRDPHEANYIDDIQLSVGRLHFANFGGYAMRVVYFILALITCFIIISGVLLWIEARSKKSNTEEEKRYAAKVGHIYLAICLSMFPVTALSFLIVKFLPVAYHSQKLPILYVTYFISWLLAIFYFRFKRNNFYTNKMCLLWGGVLGLFIPIANGLVTGDWIWKSYQQQQLDVLVIDLLWLFLSLMALLIYLKLGLKRG